MRLTLALVLLASPFVIGGQVPGPQGAGMSPLANTGKAVRAVKAPEVDGSADDPAWQVAPVIDGFRQATPAEDETPSFRTEVRVVYDDRNLYVLVRAHDPHPDSIVSLMSRRDVQTNSDKIRIIIDGYQDRRTGVEMQITPSGVKSDASIFSDNVEDFTWDGVWDAKATIDSSGWIAEFRVPFSQIRFSPGQSAFGFGVWRDVARRNERMAWPLFRSSRQALASQLGTLEGIEGIERGRGLELLPYAVTKNVSERSGPGEWKHPQKFAAGADLKVGLTSTLTLDATVNPDFGQVEADPAVLNLTAFEIRFEERRPFFQEGVGLFRCNGSCEGIFYTRRIGRAPQLGSGNADPRSTTILGAAKLTGRLGNGLSIGLVEAVTRREVNADNATIEPRTNYLVGRLVKEFRQGRSSVGVMGTSVNRDLDEQTAPFLRRNAYTALLQGYHRFDREQWELSFYTARNEVTGSPNAIAQTQLSSIHYYQRPDHEEEFDPDRTSLNGYAVAGSLSKIGGSVRWNTFIRTASPGLELNDLGFGTNVNERSIRNQISYQATRPRAFYRRTFNSLSLAQAWTTGGLPIGSIVTAHLSTEFTNFWGGAITYVVLDLAGANCVACARGGPAVRQSPKHELQLYLSGDPRRPVKPVVELTLGSGDDGHSRNWGAGAAMELRVASRFSMSVAPRYDRRIDDQQWVLNAGSFLSDTTHYTFGRLEQTTLAVTTRANWTASPNLSLQLYVQPFVSSGSFSDWRELSQARARSYLQRYAPYGGGIVPGGFNVKQFKSNAVARWEYRPGSTLFIVWQQGRSQSDRSQGSFEFGRDYRDLFRAPPDNTILIKLAYWFSP